MSRHSEVYLNKYEIRFYFIVWIGAVLYSVYEVFLARRAFLAIFRIILESDGLTGGWKWLGGVRDTGDSDWNMWMGFLKEMMPWVFIQLLISQVLKQMKIHTMVIYSWYIIVTSTFLLNYCGFNGLRYLLYPLCIRFFIIFFPDKMFLNVIIILAIATVSPGSLDIAELIHPTVQVEFNKYYMLCVAWDWTLLRTFCCPMSNDYKKETGLTGFFKNIIRWTAYCWYLPTLFLGPHIAIDEFIKGVEEPVDEWTMCRIIVHVLKLMRFIFYMFFTEFILHFVYVNAMSMKPHTVMNLNAWAFYGLTYCLGQYFYHKYFIVYGIIGEISRADNINAPPLPKCIGRIHLYSDMWRHFDRGLYEFLVSYIYVPMLNRGGYNPMNKFVAMSATFLFVAVLSSRTHKLLFPTILLNFMGSIVESIARSIGNSSLYTRLQEKYITPRNHRRFTCILAIPLLIFLVVANLISIHGIDYALYFYDRLVDESPFVIVTLMFVLYCCCQVSTEMKLIEKFKANENESQIY